MNLKLNKGIKLVAITIMVFILFSCGKRSERVNNNLYNKSWEVKKASINDGDVTEEFKKTYFRLINFEKEEYHDRLNYNIIPKGYGGYESRFDNIVFYRASVDSFGNTNYRDTLRYPIYNIYEWDINKLVSNELILKRKFKANTYEICFVLKDTVFISHSVI